MIIKTMMIMISPMLFALYVAGLGNKLHASRLGVALGNEVLAALFSADDDDEG